MDDNKKIALNTVVIYGKLIITAIIGLITSRIVLRTIGVDDFGLYTVVGGIVTFLNVIGTTMVSVSYRFIAVELGKNNIEGANRIYNTVYLIHITLAIALLVIGEIIGLYYVQNYLNVSPDKIPDAIFVLNVSLVTTAIAVMSVPANGLIIAREKFLFTSIVELTAALLKLFLVIELMYHGDNKLRLYAVSIALVTLLTRVAYQLYCKKKEKEIIRWRINKNKKDYKEVFSFAGWSLFGASAYTGKEQGAAMVINYFFGTALNSAFGIASQINSYAMMFTKSLSQAAIPQIMKSYGSGNSNRSLSLVYSISRLSTIIFMVMIVPLTLCINPILELWLGVPPKYTDYFAVFLLVNALVSMFGAGFDACIQSTGNIKFNEIIISIIYLSIIPIMFVLYIIGCPPYANVMVLPLLSLIIKAIQCFILKRLTAFDVVVFLKKSLLPSLAAITCAFIPMIVLKSIMGGGNTSAIVLFFVSAVWALSSAFFIGMNRRERQTILSMVNNLIKKYKR